MHYEEDNCKLHVSGIMPLKHIKDDDIRIVFEPFGKLVDVIRTGSNFFFFAVLSSAEDADRAMRELNGKPAKGLTLGDHVLKLNPATPRPPRENRGYDDRDRGRDGNPHPRGHLRDYDDRDRGHHTRGGPPSSDPMVVAVAGIPDTWSFKDIKDWASELGVNSTFSAIYENKVGILEFRDKVGKDLAYQKLDKFTHGEFFLTIREVDDAEMAYFMDQRGPRKGVSSSAVERDRENGHDGRDGRRDSRDRDRDRDRGRDRDRDRGSRDDDLYRENVILKAENKKLRSEIDYLRAQLDMGAPSDRRDRDYEDNGHDRKRRYYRDDTHHGHGSGSNPAWKSEY